MYFLLIVIGIFLFSFILALRSLRQLSRSEEIGSVKQELKKGKTIFQTDRARYPEKTSEV